MNPSAKSNGPRSAFKQGLKRFSSIGFQPVRFFAIFSFQILVLTIFLVLHEQLLDVLPALSAVFAFTLFLLPGAALSFWFLPGLSSLERLAIAFILSVGIMILPGVLVLTLHMSLDVFVLIFSILAVIGALCLAVYFSIQQVGMKRVEDKDKLNTPLAVILLLLAGGLCYTSFQIPLIGDDWAGMVFLQNFLVVENVNLYEPFHGTSFPPTSRSEFGVWGLDFAMLSRLSGQNPIEFYSYLRPMMVLISLIAFYILSRQVLSRRNAAGFVTAFWMISLLASIVWGDPGYDLVARINQDKFALLYILLPIALFFFLRYFQTRKLRYLIFFGLAAWTAGGTHPIGPVLIGFCCLGFGLIHLALERDLKTLSSLVYAAFFLGIGMILPLIQLLGLSDEWLAFRLQDTIDPNLLTRLSMATRAGRLWLLPGGNYSLHPAAILEPINLIALLTLPFLAWKARKSLSARLLLGTFLVIPILLYLPTTGRIIGQLVTPWLLYRLLWPLRLTAAIAIGWGLWAGVDYLNKALSRTQAASWTQSILPLVLLGVLTIYLAPSIRTGQVYLEDARLDPNRAQCQEEQVLLKHLPEIITSDSMVLADHDLNFCVPAFSPNAKVLEYRWTTTLSRFPAEHRDEALQRVKDMLYYASAEVVDTEFAFILDRYDVKYILIEEERSLNIQLQRLDTWFEPLIQEGRLILYGVKEKRPPDLLVDANTAMMQGEWEHAKTLYSSAIEEGSNNITLAHLGLGELYLNQGLINQSIEELEKAVSASPSDGLVRSELADALVAAGRVDDAIAVYEQAVKLAPKNSLLPQSLGRVYHLSGEVAKAQKAYERSVDLSAPRGTTRWYKLLGNLYARAGWHNKSLDAYKKSLAILPRDITVELAIGDIYLSTGDLNQAKAAYQRSAQLDHWAATPVMRLGLIDASEGNISKAIQMYRRAVQLEPITQTSYALLAAAIREKEGEEAALQAIQNLPGYGLTLPGPLMVSGSLYASQGRYSQASNEFERAIARFPLDTNNIKIALGSIKFVTRNWDAAFDLFDQVLIEDPTVAVDVYTNLGQIHTDWARFDQALGYFYRAVRFDPSSATAHLALAKGYTNQAQPEMAVAEYQWVLNLQPANLEAHILLGKEFIDQGKEDLAIDIFLKAVDLHPDEAVAHIGLARAYQKIGLLSEAMQAFEDAEKASPDSPAVRLILARVFQTSGEIEAALTQYLQAVQVDPTRLPANRAFGYFLLDQSNAEAAAESFRKAIELKPNDGRNRIGLAQVLLRMGSFDEALQQLQTAVEYVDRSGSAYEALGDEFRRLARWEQAISAYRQAIQIEPTRSSSYIRIGEIYEKLGDWDAAINEYEAAVKVDPGSGSALTMLGAAFYALGETEAALEILYQAIEVEPTYTETYSLIGKVLQSAGRTEEAQENYERVTNRMPFSATSWLMFADFQQNRGQLEEALEAYQQAVKVRPGNVSAWLNLSHAYRNQAQFDNAEESIMRAIELEPGNTAGYIALGDLLFRQGRIEEAEEIYGLATSVDQSSIEPYLHLSESYLMQGRIDDAFDLYKRATEITPSDEQGHIGIGTIFDVLGDADKAQKYYENALEITPTSGDALVALGKVNQNQGNWDKALTYYKQATLVESHNTSGWISLGDFFRIQGNFLEAERAYRNAISANMEDPSGYIGLGILYQELGWTDEALVQYQAAVKFCPGSTKAHLALGNWHLSNGDLVLAEESYLNAQRVRPNDPVPYLDLGSLYEIKAEITTAENLYQQAIEIAPLDLSGYLALGRLRELQGDFVEAETLYHQAIMAAPTNPEGHLYLGSLYNNLGKWDLTQAEFKALEETPTSSTVLVSLGKLYQQLARKAETELYFENASKLDRDHSNTSSNSESLDNISNLWSKSIASFEQAIDISPFDLTPYSSLAQTYQYMGDYASALSTFNRGIEYSLDKPGAYLARADLYATQGDWEAAHTDYETGWQLNPYSKIAGLQFAKYLRNRGELEKSLQKLSELDELFPNDYLIQFELGNTYVAQSNWPAAVDAYFRSINKYSGTPDPYIRLGNIYELQGKTIIAHGSFEIATYNSQHDPSGFINLGDFFQAQRDYDSALLAYEKALSLDPSNAVILAKLDYLSQLMGVSNRDMLAFVDFANSNPTVNNFIVLGQLYQLEGEWAYAKNWLQKAISLDPNNIAGWLAIGDFYRAFEQEEQALNAFNEALKLKPTSSTTLLSIGSVQEEIGNVDDALLSYQRAIESDPGRIDGYIAVANLLYEDGHSDQAITILKEGIAIASNPYQGFHALGKIYVDLGDLNLSMETFQDGLDQMPGAADIYVGMGDVYTDRVIKAQAKVENAKAFVISAQRYLEKAEAEREIAKSRREIHIADAKIASAMQVYNTDYKKYLSAQSDYELASSELQNYKTYYLQALDLQPSYETALIGLGRAFLALGSPEEALEYFEDSAATHPNSISSLSYLGNTYLGLNRSEEAIEIFQRMLLLDPHNIDASVGLARAYTFLDQIDMSQAVASVQHGHFGLDSVMDFIRKRGNR